MTKPLTEYRHCVPDYFKTRLQNAIDLATQAGFQVIRGKSERISVPNAYRSAYKMLAPFYQYANGQIELVPGKLENRPNGKTIPGYLSIAPSALPIPACFSVAERDQNKCAVLLRF